jgi:uncharacterized coiled-coil DUF342 family protein
MDGVINKRLDINEEIADVMQQMSECNRKDIEGIKEVIDATRADHLLLIERVKRLESVLEHVGTDLLEGGHKLMQLEESMGRVRKSELDHKN